LAEVGGYHPFVYMVMAVEGARIFVFAGGIWPWERKDREGIFLILAMLPVLIVVEVNSI